MKNPPFFIRDNYQQGDVDKGLDTRITAAIEEAKLAAATAKAKTEEPKKAEPKPAPFHRATLEELKAAGIKVQFEGEYKNSFAENSGFDFVEFKQQMENVAESLDLRIDEFLIIPDEKKFEFAVRLKNKDGKTAIRLSRKFYKTGNNKIECYHAGFTIDPSLQGKGISKQVFAKLYTEYQRMGVDVLTVDANLDVGGYTWTKYGFNANRNAALAMAKGNKKDDCRGGAIHRRTPDTNGLPDETPRRGGRRKRMAARQIMERHPRPAQPRTGRYLGRIPRTAEEGDKI